ncbi:hypothetical protein [Bosea sp. ASV33]|uniref:hypothetical protein n=1 Tax=Bosea sp. ASV33 TaxID=2795106 RepID=UPI0018EBC127|nr:hypothetical protein [Bosea sp. ASV33]
MSLAAAAWAVLALRDLPPRGLLGMAQAARVGQTFEIAALQGMLAKVEPLSCAGERQSVLLLHLALFDRSANLAWAGGSRSDDVLAGLNEAALARLRCTPSDSLAWFALYLVSIRQDGLGPSAIARLTAAYRNAPHEAWLQMLRLPAALAAWNGLPETLRKAALNDFDDLVAADLNPAVAAVLVKIPATRREALLAKLCPLQRTQRAAIAYELQKLRSDLDHPCLIDESRPIFMR